MAYLRSHIAATNYTQRQIDGFITDLAIKLKRIQGIKDTQHLERIVRRLVTGFKLGRMHYRAVSTAELVNYEHLFHTRLGKLTVVAGFFGFIYARVDFDTGEEPAYLIAENPDDLQEISLMPQLAENTPRVLTQISKNISAIRSALYQSGKLKGISKDANQYEAGG